MKRIQLLILTLGFIFGANAQRNSDKKVESSNQIDNIVNQYTDSLYQLRKHYDSGWKYKGKDVLTNPYYYRLFVRPTFYFNPIKKQMDLTLGQDSLKKSIFARKQDDVLMRNNALNDFFADIYVQNPYLVEASQEKVDQTDGLRQDLPKEVEHKVELATNIQPSKPVRVVEPIQVVSHKPNFWKVTQKYSLQLTQNYISDNWYQGGNNFNSMLATINLTANYNNQRKLIFENSLNAMLGFQTVKADTVHHFQTTTDQIRMINKLGIKAISTWYYTVSLNSWTQMMPKYATNSKRPYSDFMSPFESVLSIGMEYKLNKKKFNMSATVNPLSFDLKYVERLNLATRYGNKANHSFREYYGSNTSITYNWTILKELSWGGRLYYFTNYHKVQAEWESTFNFTINKYMSTKLYMYPRFDDTQFDKKRRHRMQFKQFLSLSFNW